MRSLIRVVVIFLFVLTIWSANAQGPIPCACDPSWSYPDFDPVSNPNSYASYDDCVLDNPGCQDVPIDSKVWILLVTGVFYGMYLTFGRRSKVSNPII